MVLDKDSCVRYDDINTNYAFAFNVGENNDRVLNGRIAECVDKNHSSKLMSPRGLRTSSNSGELIHISWTSAVFGFLDDMYIMTEADSTDPNIRILNIQS